MHAANVSGLVSLSGAQADLGSLAWQFAEYGRVRVSGILADDFAATLHASLQSWPHWRLVTTLSGSHREFHSDAMEELDTARREQFDVLVHETARAGFQYLFENYPLYDLARAGELTHPVLRAALDAVRSDEFLNLARAITGHEEISYSDAQATCFQPGHFLTSHNDDVSGKNRIAAYVLNLTPGWRADFGGQLQFIAEDGDVEEAYVPRFNTLSLFKVPADHAVSVVAPFAPGGRYAITGWLRSGEERPGS